MLHDGEIEVSYGLTSDCELTMNASITAHVAPSLVETWYSADAATLAVEDTLVMTLPAKQMYPGESFELKITARGDETISYAKFG
jgi:hypothetical protein